MISAVMRVLLILVAIGFFFYIVRKIKFGKMQIDDSIFWIILAAMLVLIAIFPSIAIFAAKLCGVQSPINFVYLAIIFILMVRVLMVNVKLSQLEIKLRQMIQESAIEESIEKNIITQKENKEK